MFYVYQLVDPRDSSPFYIGKGTKDRAYSHEKFQSRCNNPHKDRIIQKIHKAGLNVIVEFIATDLSNDEAVLLEEETIANIGIDNLSNICESANPPILHGEANGFYGKTHSDETKKKLGDVNRGKDIKTAQGKKAISNSMKASWADPTYRDKQIKNLQNRRGEKRSEAARESYKASAKARDEKMGAAARSERSKKAAETRKKKYAGLRKKKYIDENGKTRFMWVSPQSS